MSQHFLLSAKARTLSLKRLFDMSDAEAFDLFKELRWGKGKKWSALLQLYHQSV